MMKVLHFSGKLPTRLLIFLIASVVFASYLPALNNGFVWDDYYNFIENLNYRGLSPSHLYWMFTTLHDLNYHPLLWLTYGFDFVLWGMNPAGYHLTSLVLHGLNAILFYLVIVAFLRRAANASDVGLSAVQLSAVIGALFFGVHPLRAETVACISIRGELLCGFFYLLTVITYLRMNNAEKFVDKRKWFLLALLFFVCSLLSKAWGITMPIVLLILDIYPLGRLGFDGRPISSLKKLVVEKIPFAMFALFAATLAFLAKKPSMLKVAQHDIVDRFMQAAYGLCFYIWKMVLPIRLSPLYLLEKTFNPMGWRYILGALAVFGITVGLIIMGRRWPWAITTWICYVVIVSPLLGLVQSGPQLVADRYTYIACMPFGVLAGAGVNRLLLAWHESKLSFWKVFAAMTVIWLGLIVMSTLSFSQTRIYHDNYTLWTRAVQLDPANYIAFNNRGVFLKEQKGDLTRALADYNKAIELDPENEGCYYNRGLLYEQQGNLAGAIADYSSVIRLNPGHAKAYNNRGVLRNSRGDLAGAMADFNTAIRLAPFSPEAYANRGMIRLSQNELQRAVQDFTKVLEVASDNWASRKQVEDILMTVRLQLENPGYMPVF